MISSAANMGLKRENFVKVSGSVFGNVFRSKSQGERKMYSIFYRIVFIFIDFIENIFYI